MPKHQDHSGEHTDSSKSEVNCAIFVITARNQPSQPSQPLQARANTNKRKRKHRRYESQPSLPQPLQAEAKAEASKSQGQQPQPPQPPLGGAEIKAQAEAKPESKQAKARRRRAERKRTPTIDANKRVSPRNEEATVPRNEKEYDQAEVKTHAKRLRADTGGQCDLKKEERPRPIKKPKFPPSYRSITPHFPSSKSKPKGREISSQIALDCAALAHYHSQTSKSFRANLKAQRDFSFTLESLSHVTDSATDSEYLPSSHADSIPSSGQSTPKSILQIPSDIDVDLFGFQAKSSQS